MPRAPHSSALFAGSPRAKRSVFSTSRSRTRSMPLSSDISTRLTRGTGCEPPRLGVPDEGVGGGEIRRGGGRRREPLQRLGDPLEDLLGVIATKGAPGPPRQRAGFVALPELGGGAGHDLYRVASPPT